MKNKRLAILLSAAMTLTSLQIGGALVYAEDFSAEDFVSEDSFTDESIENDTEMDAFADIADDDFSSGADDAEAFFAEVEEEATNEVLSETSGVDIVINEDNFPDDFFREYVAGDFDSNQDGVLSSSEAAAVTSMTDLYGENISSLKGIEYFSNLQYLDCSENYIETLDVSNNTALIKLSCYTNNIKELDFSHNANLEILNCGETEIKELDLSKNTKLKELDCSSLDLENLDVSGLPMLEDLVCCYNKLQELDLTGNPKLVYLNCAHNLFTRLNLSNNSKLQKLDCSRNLSLTELDVQNLSDLEELRCSNDDLSSLDVTQNSKLRVLDCFWNKLNKLDLSNNSKLEYLSCGDNKLTALDLKNQQLLGCDRDEEDWTEGTEYIQRFSSSAAGSEANGWSLDLGVILGSENLSKIKTIGSTTGVISEEEDSDSWNSAYVSLKADKLNWSYDYKPQYIYLLLDTGYTGKYYKDINLEIVLSVSYKDKQDPVMEDDNFVYENNEDGTVAVIKYKGQEKDVAIPETFDGKKVTQIRCGKDGIYGVFAGKDITSVTMPSIELIGMTTFDKCTNLKTVYMPNVKNIGLSAFAGSGVTSIDAPLLTGVLPYVFSDCINLTTVNMPELTRISQYGFYGCKNLKEFSCSEKITTLIYGALSNTGLTSIKLYGNVEISGEQAFGYYEDENGNRVPVPGFKVYGEKSTTVEEYAKANGFEFIDINSQPVTCAHQWEEITEAATCTKEGLTYRKCKLCGEKEVGSEKTLPKTEHKTSVKNQKNATCTEKGYAGDKVCDVCGTVVETGKEIPATGHKTSVKNQKTATCTEKGYTGDKICDICGATVEKGKEIPAAGHKYGDYKVTKAATIFEEGTEKRECSVCKAQDFREISKLASSVKLTATSLPVQVKKSVSASALIASMESGDSIASLKTSNAKVAAVNNSTFKIATKKAGKATITVTLKSGASANITVNVKKGKVAATKITGIKKTVTLKKGKKLTLKPVLSPITCTVKVTYTSSNKKVATVSAKGVVKALKKGKATIKVKAGKKTVTCKVTVK